MKIPGHLKRFLHPRLVSTRRAMHARALGPLGSADVSPSPQALACPPPQSDGPRGRPASREDQPISSAPGTPGNPRADLPVTWQLRGRSPSTNWDGGPRLLSRWLVQAGRRQHVVVGDALGPRPFPRGRSPAKRKWKGGPRRNSWLADKA